MGVRSRGSRSNHPLLVAAAAITRAIDPACPSRITVIRLLGDALHTIQESQLAVDAVRSRAASFTASKSASISRVQLEADARTRTAHEHGCRALFMATVAVLLKLPSRGGPLRRRAVQILTIAARAAGPAVAMAAADRCRSHIDSLKRLTWTSTDSTDFDVVCSVLTLAEISSCHIAGRQVASDSIYFLLSPRVRQKCKRPELSYAIAVIVQSFPPHAPPDDRLVDNMLEYALSSSSVKQGSAGFGSALLTAVLAPFLVSRGPQPSDDVVTTCAKALRVAPSPTERAMWALGMVRASVTARRSPVYQLQKYGTAEVGSKFPQQRPNGGAMKFEKDSDDFNPAKWVSNNIFEDSLLQIARETHLAEGDIDASISVAAVLRMWSQALPDSIPIIIPNTIAKLMPDLKKAGAASTLVDAIWLGLLKSLKPSLSTTVFKGLIPSLESEGMELAATLHLCAVLIAMHGRQALNESGVTTDYRDSTKMLIASIHSSLDSQIAAVRLSAVRLMDAVVQALPRTCSHFLTTTLQNLRISDLALATKRSFLGHENNTDLDYCEPELSSLLGNAAALSVLIERVTLGKCSVPSVLKRQVMVDSLALLNVHLADQTDDVWCRSSCIRRKAGWGLIAALARGKLNEMFHGDNLNELIALWKEEVGYATARSSKQQNAKFFNNATNNTIPDVSEILSLSTFEATTLSSSTRSAALRAIVDAMQNVPSPQLEQCASAISSACSARIAALLASINVGVFSSGGLSGSGFVNLSLLSETSGDTGASKKRLAVQLIRSLTAECIQLVQCFAVVPPKGDSGELSYLISVSLAEEAQKIMGEDNSHSGFVYSASGGSSYLDKSVVDAAIPNRRMSLYHLSSHLSTLASYGGIKRRRPEKVRRSTSTIATADRSATGWMFDTVGISSSSPEHALMHSARAVAAIVAEDLVTSGSLIESMSSATLSPPMSASVCLELTKRLCRSDLAEINRALAMLQVLARKALTVTSGSQRSIASQNKTGRIYTPVRTGDGNCHEMRDLPGHNLQLITQSGRWLGWARAFSDEGHIARVPYHNYHTRALGVMYATRTISAEAHRELSITGGPALWVGLMRRVISTVRENVDGSSASQSVILSNAIAALGALLEVVPEPSSSGRGDGMSPRRKKPEECDTLDEASDQAVDIIAQAIEDGKSEVQATAALALSSCSHRVASASERLLGALLRAWSEDRGDFASLGHFGKCADEVDVWVSCFGHVWYDMGVRQAGTKTRFFTQDSHGVGWASSSFVTAAAAVVSSCRLHWWPLSESSNFSVKEMSIELLEWTGETSSRARAAGIYGMTALWAAKIDSVQAEGVSNSISGSDTSGTMYTDEKEDEKPMLPADSFSLKDQSRFSSPVGPFLDEILYDALAPSQDSDDSIELHDSATRAVQEMIRGAGAAEICTNLPRLPESLFATVDSGVSDAEKVVLKLAQADAARRPRYWFGLCRAICLDGERLNYGPRKAVWDVSLATKRFTVRVAADALEASITSCICSLQRPSSSGFGNHSCAYSFMRKVVDFVQQISGRSCTDFEICYEGCKLLQRVTSKVDTLLKASEEIVDLLPEFKGMWESCLPTVEALLSDRAPDCVVQAASSVIAEYLLLSMRRKRASESSIDSVIIFLENMMEKNSRKQFIFADQGEEVSTRTVLGFVAMYGMLVSALAIVHDQSIGPLNPLIPKFLVACCGDFVSAILGDGANHLALNGGSVTPPLVSKKSLTSTLSLHIAPIVFGAISSACLQYRNVEPVHCRIWENDASPGVKVLLEKTDYLSVILATAVWVIKQGHGESFKLDTTSWSCFQCQEALTCLLKTQGGHDILASEAFVSFAQWNQTELLKFAEKMSGREDLPSISVRYMIELVLSVLLIAVNDELSTFKEIEAKSVVRALSSLQGLSRALEQSGRDNSNIVHGRIVEALVQMAAAESVIVASVFSKDDVQCVFCELLSECISRTESPSTTVDSCYRLTKSLIYHGIENDSLPHVKVGISVLVTLEALSVEISMRDIINILVTGRIFQSEGENGQQLLKISLGCHGVEEFVSKVVNEGALKSSTESLELALLLMHQLGDLGGSSEQFDIPAALRCSLSAVLAEGEQSQIINSVGMVLYSRFTSLLIRALPTKLEDMESLSEEGRNCADFFAEMVEERQDCLETLVSSLEPDERERASAFMTLRHPKDAGTD